MTKKLILIALTSIALYSCNPQSETNKVDNKIIEPKQEVSRTEITPFIISEVILNDTNALTLDGYYAKTNGKWHPTETIITYQGTYAQMTSGQIQKLLQKLISSKEPKVYLDIDSNQISQDEIFIFANYCDSISDFDDTGKETKRYLACDSAYQFDGIRKIIFYETWYLNSINGGIEKEILGYTLCHDLHRSEQARRKNRYKKIFHVFNDEASLVKVKKYMSMKTR